VGLFLKDSNIENVAHRFIFFKRSSSAFEDHQILIILTSQWKSSVSLSVLQGVLSKSKQKKVTRLLQWSFVWC